MTGTCPLCCTSAKSSHFSSHDPGEGQIFSNRSDERILHEVEGQLSQQLRTAKRPDRVYGLRMTKSFVHYTAERSSLTHNPFKDERLLYPFLVIEAKSEKGSPGFESIETQSALAIRTCLLLQGQLETATQRRLYPIAWFLAYQGDEWRLYAGVPDRHDIVRLSTVHWRFTKLPECHRLVARQYSLTRRSLATVADHRLHMQLGKECISTSSADVPCGWRGTSAPGNAGIYPVPNGRWRWCCRGHHKPSRSPGWAKSAHFC